MILDVHLILQALSFSAITTTIALFFCGIPICLTIHRQGGIGEISDVPFLMGLVGGSFWLRYGLLKLDYTMIIVNLVGVACFAIYCLFYLYYSWPTKSFAIKLGLVYATIIAMIVWIAIHPNLSLLGVVCMTFNILNFGAPLAGLGVVLKNREVSTLPFPMCVANFLVSSQWCFYGYLVNDIFIVIPNGIGVLLAVLQLSLFIVFPANETERSPLEKVAAWFAGRELDMIDSGDIEFGKHAKSIEKMTMFPSVSQLNSVNNLISRPPSYKSRSSSVPDISSLNSE
ncbi:unnamed protein product [Caenorhabditis bovis]|uniref:Sugar transporter SWEET n=1 Tax=Caenorhabditis bovis TaxID=2654633 RepID=A0A8S1F6J7_9PELO|nr:unnamed protein product [Caenorhabditis bovis]